MAEILKQLYLGLIEPEEQLDISDKEFKRITAAYDDAVQKFCETLNETQKAQFEQIKYIKNENDREYDVLNFKKGFQLGMQLTLAGLEIPHIKPKNDFE